MSEVFIHQLPSAVTPILGTDTVLVSRDNIVLSQADASQLPISDTTQTALNSKANITHIHSISDVTNLQTILDGKAATSHSHNISDITGLQTTLDTKQTSAQVQIIAAASADTSITELKLEIDPFPQYQTQTESDTRYATAAQGILAETAAQLDTDVNGNYIANIIPRTNTLNNLISLAVSGQGEVASSTDVPSLVQFFGPAGSGTSYVYSPMRVGVWNESNLSTDILSSNKESLNIRSSYLTGDTVGLKFLNIMGATAVESGHSGGVINIKGGNTNSIDLESNGGTVNIDGGDGVQNNFGDGQVILSSANAVGITVSNMRAFTDNPADKTKAAVSFFDGVGAPKQDVAYITNSGTSGTGYTLVQVVAALKNLGILA